MKLIFVEDSLLPSECPILNVNDGKGCGVKFTEGHNIFQETDGSIFCSNCGTLIGRLPKKQIKVQQEG